MTVELEIPNRIPVMTLPDTVFFPQVMLPLYIYEPRYRAMVKDALDHQRIFAVAAQDPDQDEGSEPCCRIATAGLIRACQANSDGTSNLVLQGLCRVEFVAMVQEEPYRYAEIRPLYSIPGKPRDQLLDLKRELLGCLNIKRKLGSTLPGDMFSFLKGIEEPDTLADFTAFSLLEEMELKQELLETLDTSRRLETVIHKMRKENEEMRLRRKLQGKLRDDDISGN